MHDRAITKANTNFSGRHWIRRLKSFYFFFLYLFIIIIIIFMKYCKPSMARILIAATRQKNPPTKNSSPTTFCCHKWASFFFSSSTFFKSFSFKQIFASIQLWVCMSVFQPSRVCKTRSLEWFSLIITQPHLKLSRALFVNSFSVSLFPLWHVWGVTLLN